MASPTRWTWIWVDSRSWWWTGRPGVLQFMWSQKVRHNWVNWTEIVLDRYSDKHMPPYAFFSPMTCVCAKLLCSCLTLCHSMDSSPPGSLVQGILQARILEWVTMPSSRGSFQPRDQTGISYIYLPQQVGSLPLAQPGKPLYNDPYFQLIKHLWFRHLLILI